MSDAAAVPMGTPAWQFEPGAWLETVRGRWPRATGAVIGRDDRATAAYAVLPAGDGSVEVELLRDGCTVTFEPLRPDAIADFVAWWASVLPSYEPEVHLFVMSDADRSLPLTAGLTADQVRDFLGV
ncbi:hypothetical protein [Dactylosporangium sp. CS-033363]|uniref:hypothetical protein n=1 Tax=Dactylosporangium sp. CS-033363 TaxID=3239935 RepID=UPI003D91020D